MTQPLLAQLFVSKLRSRLIGWLVPHATSAREISDLLAVIDRDFKDCRAERLSPDRRLNIAYNAALLAATASS